MRQTLSIAACVLVAPLLHAQPVSWDNVHINVTDPARAAEWYSTYLGGAAVGTPGQATQVKLGNVLIVFLKGQQRQQSAGSLIDHIGLSYGDVDAQVKRAEEGGAKVLNPPRDVAGLFKLAFIEDPFGIKIEMVQDADQLGFHHVHLAVPNPGTTLQWYQDMFGGERAKLKGRIDGLRYGGVWLLAQNNGGKTSNPNGAIQYIGLLVPDIHQKAAELKSKNVKFSVEARQLRSLWYAIAQDVDGSRVEMIQRFQPPSTARGEWPTYGGDLGSSKYSPLDQITKDNFSKLRIAWRAKTPDASLSMTFPGGGDLIAPPGVVFGELKRIDPKRWRDNVNPSTGNFKATPLMVGGVLYLNSPISVGAALDAKTGATRWAYNPKSYESGTTTMSARWNERGVAYWTDGQQERILWGTGDGYLIAVDAKTGRPCEDFGKNGRVDLMEGLPRAKRGDRDFLNALTYSVQSPPIVVRDVVITPASISSYIINKEQIPGWLRAFDVRTGKLKWTFHTIPRPGEYGIETWKDDSWAYAGKATVWSMMSADPELGYLYVPTNTTAPDFYGGHRHGNNLFAETILCLDIETGKRVWHFQTVHHGLWDYDNPAAPTLMNVTVDGKPVKALAQITKQGFLFALDRVTGKPIWPIEERPVPPSDIPGEEASPTQPFPTKPAPFEYQGALESDLADFTPDIRAMALETVKGLKLGPLYTPPSLAGTIQRPSTGGGGNWGGAAVDPETGILYVPSRNAWSLNALELPDASLHGNLRYMEARAAPPRMKQGLQLFKPPYTRMTAIDMNKGEHIWMVPTGNGDRLRNNPLLKPLNLPPLGGDGLTPGPLLTKTLLIYGLSAGGSGDGPRLVAYDKATGKELASTDIPGIPLGTPMTYMLGDKQFIALTVSGRPGELPELVALALP